MTAAFGVKFEGMKTVFVDQAKIRARYESAARRGLGRVGAILRQEARKSIPRRVATPAMWARYHAARDAKDYRRAYQIAQQIDRRRNMASAAGDPPFAHVPDSPVASIRAIYFAVGKDGRDVTVGPVRANQVNYEGSKHNRVTVPELMEFGGTATIFEWRFTEAKSMNPRWARRFKTARKFSDQWMRRDQRWRNVSRKRGSLSLADIGLETRQRSAAVAPRPFMGPTLTRSQAVVRTILSSAFKGAA